VYGSGTLAANRPQAASPMEQSGSLTGHILSHGIDMPSRKADNSTTRVVVIMTIVLAILVIAGLVVAIFARNALLDILTGA
jgi:hypothetical protein